MSPEQNKNPQNNVIDLDQKRQEKIAAAQAAQAEQETTTEAPQPKFWLRRLIAGSAIALSALGVAKAAEVAHDVAPKVAAVAEGTITNTENFVTDIINPAAELTSSVNVTVQKGDTLTKIAERADPAADPSDIIHKLKDEGVTPGSIQPGEVVSVPVSPEAAAHDEQLQK